MDQYYKQKISANENLLKTKQKIFNILGNCKLLLFFGLLILVYFIYKDGFTVPLAASFIILFTTLIVLWIYQGKLYNEIDFHTAIIKICIGYLSRIEGTWTDFEDIGEEFINSEHPYSGDLDIVGKNSLFQLLNVTNTWHGRNKFAGDLLNSNYNVSEINERLQAVHELSEKKDFSNIFQYNSGKIGVEKSVPEIVDSLSKDTDFIKSPILMRLLLWLPLITVPVSFIAISFSIRILYTPSTILIVLQLLLWIFGFSKTNKYLSEVSKAPYVFGKYSHVLKIIREENFNTALLNKNKEKLSSGNNSAYKAIKELDTAASKTNIKNNGLIWLVFNVLLLWDFRCAIQLSKWKQKYGSECGDWFIKIGELESLLSFSNLINVCSSTCAPEIQTEKRIVRARNLGHPLLLNDSRICNSMLMEDEIFIISGSNMSGKTTFLRTVGINIILAKAGSFVCAEAMNCSLFDIKTSMRITDDLKEGISTFYAELKRIKIIIESARNKENLFFLIDEIFRGTNSEDRLFGASNVIKELSSQGVMGIITTHDLSLCKLENECKNVKNYSFNEKYDNDKMYFDYVLRNGKSNTTNARFLMQKIGIL